MNKRHFISALWLLCSVIPAHAAVTLGSPFTDHMVLQREVKVPVWGRADAGETVTVDFGEQRKTSVADSGGHWMVRLDPMSASSESRELFVHGDGHSGQESLTCTDVLVGEVWLASGQSNMDFTLSAKIKRWAGVLHEDEEIASANHPLLRLFTGTAAKAYQPQKTVGGQWQVCSPENAPAFPAVAYFFGRDLRKELGVPVGIITLAFGASTAESWVSREAIEEDSELKPMLGRFDAEVEKFLASPPVEKLPPPSEDVLATNAASVKKSAPAAHDPVLNQHNPTVMFNGMVAPVIPYAIRGVIWYQGESIVGGSAGISLYPLVQAALVRNWRKLWGEGDFPFYIVQLAGYEKTNPSVREAQSAILSLPNTGMIVTADIGECKNVHPKNKQDVGARLARLALARAYGRPVECSGPVYDSMRIEGEGVRVKFLHADGLRVTTGQTPLWFTIAGADGIFVPAAATIDGDSVLVSSPKVSAPVAVRYAWVNFPDGGYLCNREGLPAIPFRTDKK